MAVPRLPVPGLFLLSAAAALSASVAPADRPAFRLDGRFEQGALVRGTAPAGAVALTLDGRPLPLDAGGRFLIGFDRDAPGTARLAARLADGAEISEFLTVARRQWPIERVGMARPATGPTPEYRRLREAELARIAAARTQRSDSGGWAQRFIWPARGRISGRFGSQRIYRGGVAAAYHSGADVAAGAGATGRATGPHLHWSLMWNGARLDPQAVAGAME